MWKPLIVTAEGQEPMAFVEPGIAELFPCDSLQELEQRAAMIAEAPAMLIALHRLRLGHDDFALAEAKRIVDRVLCAGNVSNDS